MARGYPDFFGQQIFHKWGLPVLEAGWNGIIPNGDTQEIINIQGKGRTYQGNITYTGNELILPGTHLHVFIDGVEYRHQSPQWEMIYGLHIDGNQLFSLCEYDQQPAVAVVTYSAARDYTWGLSLIVQVENLSGANVVVVNWSRLLWGKVI